MPYNNANIIGDAYGVPSGFATYATVPAKKNASQNYQVNASGQQVDGFGNIVGAQQSPLDKLMASATAAQAEARKANKDMFDKALGLYSNGGIVPGMNIPSYGQPQTPVYGAGAYGPYGAVAGMPGTVTTPSLNQANSPGDTTTFSVKDGRIGSQITEAGAAARQALAGLGTYNTSIRPTQEGIGNSTALAANQRANDALAIQRQQQQLDNAYRDKAFGYQTQQDALSRNDQMRREMLGLYSSVENPYPDMSMLAGIANQMGQGNQQGINEADYGGGYGGGGAVLAPGAYGGFANNGYFTPMPGGYDWGGGGGGYQSPVSMQETAAKLRMQQSLASQGGDPLSQNGWASPALQTMPFSMPSIDSQYGGGGSYAGGQVGGDVSVGQGGFISQEDAAGGMPSFWGNDGYGGGLLGSYGENWNPDSDWSTGGFYSGL